MRAFLPLLALVAVAPVAFAQSPKTAAVAAWNAGPPMPIADRAGTVQAFRGTYAKLGRPRLLVFVNREMVRERGEMLQVERTDQSVKTKGDPIPLTSGYTIQFGADNRATAPGSAPVSGKGGEAQSASGISTRRIESAYRPPAAITEMEAREFEEIFQEPLSEADARFVDQKTAELAQRLFRNADPNFLTAPADDRERREVESLRAAADLAVEILVRKKTVKILQPSGDDSAEERVSVTATAIRLKDGVKLAQVSSDSLFGFNRRHGDRIERRYREVTSAEILEQVALAVMQRLGRP
ncbi:MAG: hypothetical protein IT578_12430 [Verrucomicrobiae bacterium]|nr:hypothetical protein [Verrucomicrobiae bacterium]